MKILFIKFCAALSLFSVNYSFKSFINFTYKNLYIPESVRQVCKWQYVIVRVKTNKFNTIASYHVENAVTVDLERNFNFLKGYHFDSKIPARNKTLVFCLSIENKRMENCNSFDTTNRKHEPIEKVFQRYKATQQKKGIRNIYIDDIITEVIVDPEK